MDVCGGLAIDARINEATGEPMEGSRCNKKVATSCVNVEAMETSTPLHLFRTVENRSLWAQKLWI